MGQEIDLSIMSLTFRKLDTPLDCDRSTSYGLGARRATRAPLGRYLWLNGHLEENYGSVPNLIDAINLARTGSFFVMDCEAGLVPQYARCSTRKDSADRPDNAQPSNRKRPRIFAHRPVLRLSAAHFTVHRYGFLLACRASPCHRVKKSC